MVILQAQMMILCWYQYCQTEIASGKVSDLKCSEFRQKIFTLKIIFSSDNFVSCLNKDDYEPVSSLFGRNGIIEKWEGEIDVQMAEIAKRYVRSIGQR